ncbi:MAG: dTDP-4-dehydrorhamnose reductase [Bacteroidetes bacterium]|nr:dTDP-4-dehydrorhamnose reductase [Bacteroidota bacterium]
MTIQRLLVVGSNGLLGQKVVELFVRGSSAEITASSVEPAPVRNLHSVAYRQTDITSKKDVRALVSAVEPGVIINCAAMTSVDACETERELAWKINVSGVEHLADAAKRANAALVHISTDYVFDGKHGPYSEDDRPEPLSYYGKTKLASENALRASDITYLILRTMVLYGHAEGVKANFALWLIESLQKKSPVKVVDDQIGNPTLVDDLAYAIMRAVELQKWGLYHIAGRDIMSRYDFAVRLAGVFGLDAGLITPIKTEDLRQPAPRPLQSGLVTLKAETEIGYRPSTVEEGLAIVKSQLSRNTRRPVGDRGPASAQSQQRPNEGRPGKRPS